MNEMWQSLNQLVQELDSQKIIELFYKKFGINTHIEKDSYIIFPTICHNAEEGSMKLYYYKDNKFFYCYTECGALSIFNLLKSYYKVHDYEYDWYEDIIKVVEGCTYGGSADFRFCAPVQRNLNVDKVRGRRSQIELPQYNECVLDVFLTDYNPVWLEEGITPETLRKYNIRFSISQNKIVIPHYDARGRLVGIRGRALDDWEVENVGKYMPLKIENTWYSHKLSLNLYGLDKTKENIKEKGICFVCEGEKSVLLAENFSFPNCAVAICGSNFNKYALSILMRECRPMEIVICFDKEEQKGSDKYFQKLYNLCAKYKNYCEFSFIYDRENLLDQKDSPFDKGEEVFQKLLQKRVRVK